MSRFTDIIRNILVTILVLGFAYTFIMGPCHTCSPDYIEEGP